MEGIKYSVLNPLAISFVPSKMRKTLSKSYEMEDEVKLNVANQSYPYSIIKFKTGKCLKKNLSNKLVTCNTLNEIFYSGTKLLNEDFYFTEKCIDTVHSKSRTSIGTHWKISDMTVLKFFLGALLALCSRYYFTYTWSLNLMGEDETDSFEDNSKAEKCTCPPMFGYIIPTDFFGNPFNLHSSCNRKRVHACHYSQANKKEISSNATSICRPETDLKDLNETTKLKQYSCALRDISGTVSSGDCVEEDSHYASINATHKVTKAADNSNRQMEVGLKRKEKIVGRVKENFAEWNRFILDYPVNVEMPKDAPTIIDDDVHQLLDEGISIEAEGETATLKKLVEPPFSTMSRLSLELTEAICDPPCSVWCDSLPQPVKYAYQKFMKSLPQDEQDLWNFKPENKKGQGSALKAPYKRSFSASDCCEKNYEYITFRSDPQSKKYLGKNLLTNQPVNEIKKCMPQSDNFPRMVNGGNSNTRCNNSMWGLFEGEDSLWESLPECTQSFDQRVKKNYHIYRDREVKRQSSWS